MPHMRKDEYMIKVTWPCGNQEIKDVNAKYENDDVVILTFDWEDSVNQRKMHEGDVCAFKFEEIEDYLVVKVH
jgi:hypothetical protein